MRYSVTTLGRQSDKTVEVKASADGTGKVRLTLDGTNGEWLLVSYTYAFNWGDTTTVQAGRGHTAHINWTPSAGGRRMPPADQRVVGDHLMVRGRAAGWPGWVSSRGRGRCRWRSVRGRGSRRRGRGRRG